MRKLSSPFKYQVFAEISGSMAFGILDNLRYIRACPFEEQDANILETVLRDSGSVAHFKFVITKWVENSRAHNPWAGERWGSGITITPLTEAEALNAIRVLTRFADRHGPI